MLIWLNVNNVKFGLLTMWIIKSTAYTSGGGIPNKAKCDNCWRWQHIHTVQSAVAASVHSLKSRVWSQLGAASQCWFILAPPFLCFCFAALEGEQVQIFWKLVEAIPLAACWANQYLYLLVLGLSKFTTDIGTLTVSSPFTCTQNNRNA